MRRLMGRIRSLSVTSAIGLAVVAFCGCSDDPTMVYTGHLVLPAASNVSFDDIVVKGAIDETSLRPDGTFDLRMNKNATGLITAEVNGVRFMMAVFPKHPDLVQIEPEVSPDTTAVAMVVMMPGVLTGDVRLDALLLGALKKRAEVQQLGNILDSKLSANVSVLSDPDADVLSGLADVFLGLSNEAESRRLVKRASLDACYSTEWPVTDGFGTSFYDVDGDEQDALYVDATYNATSDAVTLRMTNPAPRWVSMLFNAGKPDEKFVGLVKPRKIEIPGVADLMKDILSSTASSIWNEVFGDQETSFYDELRQSLDDAFVAHFECKHLELKDVDFPYADGATLNTFTLGNTSLGTDNYLPVGMTIFTQAIIPLVGLALDSSTVMNEGVLGNLSVTQVAELNVAFSVFKESFADLATAFANDDFDLLTVLDIMKKLVVKMVESDSFWQSLRFVMNVSSDSLLNVAVSIVKDVYETILNPFKWIDKGLDVMGKVYTMAYVVDVVRGFESSDVYSLTPPQNLDLCGNDKCDTGETNQSCPLDCVCVRDCTGRVCGPDPVCSQSCGTCDADKNCNASGACVAKVPRCPGAKDCTGLVCGLDPVCGVSCGTCDVGNECKLGVCVPSSCARVCGNRVCGPDPVCGQSCGTCGAQENCNATGACVAKVPVCPRAKDCAGRECGPDPVCGESCGACSGTDTCDSTGTCVPVGCGINCGEMVEVPGGAFWQGCDSSVETECDHRAEPFHQVIVSTYWIDRFETTTSLYQDCIMAGFCTVPSVVWAGCTWDQVGNNTQPVNCTTWYQAREYCEWAGKRLCTESEWEKAARGTDGRKYPWGNETVTCDYAVIKENNFSSNWGCGTGQLWPVGSKPAGISPYGVLDMVGNVGEWVEDDFHEDYDGAPTDGTAWIDSPRDDVRGWRGDSWMSTNQIYATWSRNWDSSEEAGPDQGIRCCR